MMTKKQFLKLFDGNHALYEAAVKWWEDVERCQHSYGRLWFHHWQMETRAHPQIARAFQKAVELGFADTRNMGRYLACELFKRLRQACVAKEAPAETMGLSSGPTVDQSKASVKSVTFIEVDVAEPMYDVEIERAVDEAIKRRREKLWPLALTWLSPIDDIPGGLGQSITDIRVIRDKFALVHWKKFVPKVALVWPATVTSGARIPTVLDSQSAFFVPAPENHGWGRTMDLSNGSPGVREGVVAGERSEWELAGEDGTPCHWLLHHAYDPGPDGRYSDLCEYLLIRI